jgi:predicted dehydrogenase/ribosomal protein S18 acetylase RimI-like enzyme
LEKARERLGAREKYVDYDQMLAHADINAVIIGTPMPLHVPQAVAALREHKHVLSEVPAGVNIEECRELTLAARGSRGIYMMAENYTYTKPNMIVTELVKRGLFGQTYFGDAEYIHELKALNEQTRWRRQWQTGINGNTYPTHSLGPLLQWMPGDRVAKVCHAGAGHHYKDARGDQYEQEDSVLTVCQMVSGGLVKLRIDMLSDRPHAMTNYQLQGTDGCYESARAHGERNRIWLRSMSKDPNQWLDLKDLEAEFAPAMWKEQEERARHAGHGGGDFFEVLDFVDAALGRRPPVIGIDQAMDMTLPGLVSQRSAAQGGRWLDVPDSRQWQTGWKPALSQLHMVLAAGRRCPEPRVPEGYELRQLTLADAAEYKRVMNLAGFEGWDAKTVEERLRTRLPGGFFVIEHKATGRLVATAHATHGPNELHPQGGELDFVAADPEHKGHGLGMAVCSAVVRLLQDRGYEHIYLTTDDWRLPAISIYLRLGFEPLLYQDDMAERWAAVRSKIQQK